MNAVDWWWTGRNNATDISWGNRQYHRGYWPPRGVGFVSGVCYRAGWLFGKLSPNPRKRA